MRWRPTTSLRGHCATSSGTSPPTTPGTITKVGLGTFIDPRNGGGKVNAVTTEDIVELLTIHGQEYLF